MIAADCVASSCAIQALLLCRRQESYFRCYVGSKRLSCIVLVSGMRPGGFDPGCIVIAIYCHVAIFFGGRHQAASTPVCRYLRLRFLDKTSHVQKNLLLLLEISFSSGQVLLALATHLLLWSIAFVKKTCLFAVTVSVMFQHIRTCRHSGSWASSCFFHHLLHGFLSLMMIMTKHNHSLQISRVMIQIGTKCSRSW